MEDGSEAQVFYHFQRKSWWYIPLIALSGFFSYFGFYMPQSGPYNLMCLFFALLPLIVVVHFLTAVMYIKNEKLKITKFPLITKTLGLKELKEVKCSLNDRGGKLVLVDGSGNRLNIVIPTFSQPDTWIKLILKHASQNGVILDERSSKNLEAITGYDNHA